MGGWVGPTQSIGWSCFALILIRRQRLRVNQGIEVNFVLFLSPEYISFWALECRLCASPCWTWWWVGTKRNESFRNITWHPQIWDNNQDSDLDSENEHSYNSCNNWPTFLVMEPSSDDLPLNKLSPFAVQKGFQAWWPEPSKALKGWGMDLSW